MAETSTSPLLPKSSSTEQCSSLNETIEWCIGDFGWSQLFQVVLVSFAWVFDAQQVFISIFTDAQPTWHCNSPFSSRDLNSSCSMVSDVCLLPRSSWSWDWPAHTSIVSEWSLECAGSITTGLPASSFYLGCLAGGLALATLADSSLGRKKMLLLSCLLMSMTGLLTILATNIWLYSALRFLAGFGRASVGTCALVLSSELVGRRWRGQIGTVGFFLFTLGFLSLPAIAYVNKGSSWRTIYLWTCTPTLIYCVLVHFLVHESPRWLFVQGRKEDFVATLRTIATPEKRSNITLTAFSGMSNEQQTGSVDLYSAIRILLNKTWALRRLAAVMVIGFGIGMVYYGMPLAVGDLDFNLYLSVTLNALSELPATIVTFFLIGKLNRRSALLGFTTLSGITSVMCVMIRSNRWKAAQIGMELVSFFSTCTAFDVLLIYSLELFPTCVRNSAVSTVRQALVFGGVFSPLLVAAGKGNELISYGVFGLTIGLCGLFVGCLPETRGGAFFDTLDEEEKKKLPEETTKPNQRIVDV